MATKKGAKSNKTAHVLNLLAPGGSREPAAAEAPAEVPEAAAELEPADSGTVVEVDAARAPLAPPILEVARANDAQLSEQIRGALESEFFGELKAETREAPLPAQDAPSQAPQDPPAPPAEAAEPTKAPTPAGPEHAPEPEPVSALTEPEHAPEPAPASAEPEPTPEPEPVSAPAEPEPTPEPEPAPAPAESEHTPEPEPAPAPAESEHTPEPEPAPAPAEPEPTPEPEPVSAPAEPEPTPEPEPAPAPAQPAPALEPEPASAHDFDVVNIMERLVELKAPRYIRMFGLCTCDRCAADVKALTLTHLQPSYIVVPHSEVNAMVTVYESRFNSTIFAQLTRACKIVMDNPRHGDRK